MRPAMLMIIIPNEIQRTDADMTPPSVVVRRPERTVRIAIIGSISKTESRRLNTKEASRSFLLLPENFSNRFIISIIPPPPLYPSR